MYGILIDVCSIYLHQIESKVVLYYLYSKSGTVLAYIAEAPIKILRGYRDIELLLNRHVEANK